MISFNKIHGNNLIYNTCWEDPRLDRKALDLGADDRVVVITSAGCNALDYLLAGAGEVCAVDVNFRQNALLELKVAALKELNYKDFYAFFGEGFHQQAEKLYRSRLRICLSEQSRGFWDTNIGLFSSIKRGGSFYFRGTTGLFAYGMKLYLDYLARLRGAFEELLNSRTPAEQREVFDSRIEPCLSSPLLRWMISRDLTLALLGVPKAQRKQVENYFKGGIAEFIMSCLRAVLRDLPLQDNYFWRVYLSGSYAPDCAPEYLKRENFETLKNKVDHGIKVHTTSMHTFLKDFDKPITRFVLLDHMDWLADQRKDILQQEWQGIVDRAGRNSRVIWRSGGMQVDYVDPIEVKRGNSRYKLAELLRYNNDLASSLHPLDRTHTYGSFYIADLDVAA